MLQAVLQNRFEFSQLSYFVFLQTYVYDHTPFFGVSWSLCVEEFFYLLIAPLILWIGSRAGRGVFVFLVLLTLPPLFRGVGLYGTLNEPHVRLDQCAAGVALAYLNVCFPKGWRAFQCILPVLFVSAVVGLALSVSVRLGMLSIGLPLSLYTFLAVVLVAFAERGEFWRTGLRIPGVHYLATRSYSMYLLHVEAIVLAERLDIENFFIRWCFIWMMACIAAELLYRLIELPGMRLREKGWFLQNHVNKTKNA